MPVRAFPIEDEPHSDIAEQKVETENKCNEFTHSLQLFQSRAMWNKPRSYAEKGPDEAEAGCRFADGYSFRIGKLYFQKTKYAQQVGTSTMQIDFRIETGQARPRSRYDDTLRRYRSRINVTSGRSPVTTCTGTS